MHMDWSETTGALYTELQNATKSWVYVSFIIIGSLSQEAEKTMS